ncbi:MAG: peptidyl-tRNA hydrolase [Candidatus Micrarchaeota archaeon]|nr:peptidyl-tRNA hydrolase [Candidatus Micrarchaeota archaeon]
MKQVIVINQDIKMGKGKMCAQVAHASLEAYQRAPWFNKWQWERSGVKKVVLKAPEKELLRLYDQAKKQGLNPVLIRDAGHTQLEPGTITALGIGPYPDEVLDNITGHLKLL